MTGTPLAHVLWVRWKSGEIDTIFLSEKSGEDLSERLRLFTAGPIDNYTATQKNGEKILLRLSEAATWKVRLVKNPQLINPLNDPKYYEDPLN